MGRDLTLTQRAVLSFMDDGQLWCNAEAVGHLVVGKLPCRGSNYIAVGAGLLGTLSKRHLVAQLENGGWRITGAGRATLARSTQVEGEAEE